MPSMSIQRGSVQRRGKGPMVALAVWDEETVMCGHGGREAAVHD